MPGTVIEGRVGSHFYGVAREDSDVDIVRVVQSPLHTVLNTHRRNVHRTEDEHDVVEMELASFLTQLSKGSKSALEALYAPSLLVEAPDAWMFKSYLQLELPWLVDRQRMHATVKGFAEYVLGSNPVQPKRVVNVLCHILMLSNLLDYREPFDMKFSTDILRYYLSTPFAALDELEGQLEAVNLKMRDDAQCFNREDVEKYILTLYLNGITKENHA